MKHGILVYLLFSLMSCSSGITMSHEKYNQGSATDDEFNQDLKACFFEANKVYANRVHFNNVADSCMLYYGYPKK
jgi:hypothetical protein